jgi:hypothetical protein
MVRCIFLVLSLTLFADAGRSQPVEPDRLKPVVNVQEPPNTPLKLTVTTRWATPDAQSLEIHVVVENVSELEIRTYMWCIDKKEESENNANCLLWNTESGGKILRPRDSDGKSTWRRIPLDSPLNNIEISLDFVQFADGSFWGTDTNEFAEKLRGFRAGALAVKDKFAKIQNETDGKGLIDLLKLDTLEIEVPRDHSSAWMDGFRDGVRSRFEKLKKAYEQNGLPEVKRQLVFRRLRSKDAVVAFDRPFEHHVFDSCAGADVVNDQIAVLRL